MSGELTLQLDDGSTVSALLDMPAEPRAAFVFAHGAGAGMRHAFLATVAQRLADGGIAVLRYQFPFMEHGGKRPDPPSVAQATVRTAVTKMARLLPKLPLFAGGKSFGGRMTSQAQAAAPLPAVRGIVFFGFPLHPAGKPSTARADHLGQVRCPLLFLQGTRDELADPALLRQAVEPLGMLATLHWEDGADHAFHVLKRSGRSDADVLAGTLDAASRWMAAVAASAGAAP